MSEPPRSRTSLQRDLLQHLADWLPPAPGDSPPPISDELDRLLFLFAADELSDADAARFWELVSQEPGGRRHLALTLDSLDLDFPRSALPAPALAPLGATIRSSASTTATDSATNAAGGGINWLAIPGALGDVCVGIARDYLIPSPSADMTAAQLGLAARGPTSERPTTLVKQVVNWLGVFELTVNHRGACRCDTIVRVVQALSSFPAATQRVTLFDGTGQPLSAESLAGGHARFRDLAPGEYRLEIAAAGGPSCPYALRLIAADEE